MELGCGKGEYTTELAKLNSNKNYIGIDIKGARIFVNLLVYSVFASTSTLILGSSILNYYLKKK